MAMDKTLIEIHSEAIALHALLQGAVILVDSAQGVDPACNALDALAPRLVDLAAAIVGALEKHADGTQ